MAEREKPQTEDLPKIDASGHGVLIIEAPYYADVSDALRAGALAELEAAGAGHERIVVPGALEIPQVLAQAVDAGLFAKGGLAPGRFSGVVALGCVIRGETSHYDIVCDNANHWLMRLAMEQALPLGNAILTVDTHAQAVARAEGGRLGKGGDAARACLRLIEMARDLRGRA
jgi:6,7-dimethyl-8-ribityllumazine synthase